MQFAKEQKKAQEDLNDCLKELSEHLFSEDELQTMIDRLKKIYISDFRHSYSTFFPFITELTRDGSPDCLDSLSTNLDLIKECLETNENDDEEFYKRIFKLSDHLNLEIARHTFYSANEDKLNDLEKKNQDIKIELDKAKQELSDANKLLEETNRKAKSLQSELISVLSIFAAIVITFSGSLSYISSALSGMYNAPLLKTAFFVLLCGFVTFNAIFLLVYLIAKITERNVYAKCQSENCTCDNGKPKCNSLNRVRKRLPFFFWFNIVLIILFVVVTILLCCKISL